MNEAVARAGGYHVTGQPYFRVVWGWSRLTTIGGMWDDFSEQNIFLRRVAEYRQVPKYYPVDRWHIEKLVPPEFFVSPEHWAVYTREEEDGHSFQALGSFPSRGEYEHCFTLYDPKFPPGDKRSYLDLNRETCAYVCRAVQASRYMIEKDKMGAIYRREAAREKAADSRADDILNDDNVFAGQPHIYMPSPKETHNLSVQRMG